MHRWLFLLLVLPFSADAQVRERTFEQVREVQYVDIEFLEQEQAEWNEQHDQIPGYRIQIKASSDRNEIYRLKGEVYQHFSRFKSYLVYEQPYYKLRIGDFDDHLEARRYLEEVIEKYPEAIVVPDEIKVR